MSIAERIPLLRQALVRAGAEDDGNVITIPHSVDGLIDQVKRAESRQATTEARHTAELANLTWQHKLDRDALEQRHALEKKAVDDEFDRAKDLMLRTVATRLGVDPALLEGSTPATTNADPALTEEVAS
jgi:hypothetical protein